jgi:hypothetical protein
MPAKEGAMLCEEADYILQEAKKGEYVEELFNEATSHVEACPHCKQPSKVVLQAEEVSPAVIPQEDHFSRRERELREQYPAMFDNPELQPGEIVLREIIVDAVGIQVGLYHNAGLKSARPANKPKMGTTRQFPDHEFAFYPIFANLREYLELEAQH